MNERKIEFDNQESFTQQKLMRLKRTASLVGLLGVRQAGPLLAKRIIDSDSKSVTKLSVKGLNHPFYSTAAHGDIAMLNELAGRGKYDLPKHNKIIDGSLIVDIGANIGVSAALFASRYRRSEILLVEPNPRNLELLAINTEKYGRRITTIDKALSLNSERVGLLNNEVSSIGNHASYFYKGEARSHELSAESITPEELINNVEGYIFSDERVGLLKINIEGAEKELLESGRLDSLLKLSNVVIVEAHDHFVKGASSAVLAAAERSGLAQFDKRGTFFFLENLQ